MLTLLLALGRGDPMASGSARNLDDGLHVTVTLTDLDQATFLGRTVTDGQELVLPYAELPIGIGEVPFVAEGLGPYDTLTLHVGYDDVLAPKCDIETEWGTVKAEDTSDFFAYKCAVDQGVVAIPMTAPPGATLEVTHRDSPLGGWIAAAPDSIRVLGRAPGERTTALYESGGHYWVEGDAEGKTVADIDLVVKILETGPAYDIGTCHLRTMEGRNTSAKTVGHDQTFVAYDVAGTEVGRTTLKGDDCPGYALIDKGETLSVVPGEGEVRGWVETLL
ncbi:MAG: hypothetical protein GY913_35620 [Proteobacteria bacterium]|nr:hypothetical protein [Pseudomonadota bacterium]MCP4922262.1 hypothetical protein [Pseudomonadota bacterium]